MTLAHTSPEASYRATMALAIICSILMVLDTAIVSILVSVERYPTTATSSILFFIFVGAFVFSNYWFFKYTNTISTPKTTGFTVISLIKWTVTTGQIVIALLLITLIIQMLLSSEYHLVIMTLIIYTSYVPGIIFLLFLVYQFGAWFLNQRNLIILCYGIGFSFMTLALVTSTIYLQSQISNADPVVSPRPVSDYSSLGYGLSSLATLYEYATIISFVFIWIPSALLLRAHFAGKVRYCCIVAIPLILFLFPVFANELGLVDKMFLEYGDQFSLVYYIIFSPYQQLGGLLFGMAFWVTAKKVKRRNLKALLNISGIGILLLFGSSVIHGLNYIVFPPFGIVTISFLGLASYLLLVGIYTSAKELAKDTVIRREIYRVAEKEFSLLREIGMAELDKTILTKVEPMIARLEPSWEEEQRRLHEEDDYMKFVEEAIVELQTRSDSKRLDQ